MCIQAHLELVQQLFDDLVCAHPAGDTNFSWSAERRCEDRRLREMEGDCELQRGREYSRERCINMYRCKTYVEH